MGTPSIVVWSICVNHYEVDEITGVLRMIIRDNLSTYVDTVWTKDKCYEQIKKYKKLGQRGEQYIYFFFTAKGELQFFP